MAAVKKGLPDTQGAAFFLDQAARSITLLQDKGKLFPLSPEKAGRVMLAYEDAPFRRNGLKAYPQARSYFFGPRAGVSDLAADMTRNMESADTIIVNINGKNGASDIKLLDNLKTLKARGKRIVVFSVLGPPDYAEISWADAALAAYSASEESYIAGFSAMLGLIPFRGKAPAKGISAGED
jgi:beta-N-acetylhexosaminidase